MAAFTSSTVEALRGLTGEALEFLALIQYDMHRALELASVTVRSSDEASVEELRLLRAAHARRAETLVKARE